MTTTTPPYTYEKTRYRREIDGLRAIAVLPVIFFHAGFQWFNGGYVGVDVFFVISGYLITTLILAEKEAGIFSIVRFYERRARRILPALFLVMLVCIPCAWFLMKVPDQLTDFARSLISVSLFASNIMFWRDSGYFAAAAEEKPLLHTWSLSVEEQYYLFFPLFLILFWKLGKRWLSVSLSVIALASFGLAEWASRNMPIANFYLAPMRFWELLIGALSAFLLFYRPPKNFSPFFQQSFSFLGLVLILFSIISYDDYVPFPGVYALAPTLGTALVILLATPQTLVWRVLSHRWLVGIGLISYSLYLWHQPLFAFARIYTLHRPGMGLFLMLSVLSIVLAYFTWKYVEQPFRDKHRVRRKTIFTGAVVMSSMMIGIGLIGALKLGFNKKFYLPENLLATFSTPERERDCFNKQDLHKREDWYCKLGNGNQAPTFLVFGDSHSRSFLPTFDDAAQATGESGYFVGMNGCIPFLSVHVLKRNTCHALNQRVFEFAKQAKVRKIFLIGRWTYYTDGDYDGVDFNAIVNQLPGKASIEVSRRAFVKGLDDTINAYEKAGIRLYLLAQVPQQLDEAKDIYYRAFTDDTEKFTTALRVRSVTVAEHQRLQGFVNARFAERQRDRNLQVISFDNIFCDQAVCAVGNIHESFYLDANHLSVGGAMRAVGEIKKHLQPHAQ